jgi:hypothetical protein
VLWHGGGNPSGPAGSAFTVSGTGYPGNSAVALTFKDVNGAVTSLGTVTTDATGAFSQAVTVPAGAAMGCAKVTAKSRITSVQVVKTFKVT